MDTAGQMYKKNLDIFPYITANVNYSCITYDSFMMTGDICISFNMGSLY